MHVDDTSIAALPNDTLAPDPAHGSTHRDSPSHETGQNGATYGKSNGASVAPEIVLLRSEVDELVREVRAQLQNLDPEQVTPALLIRKLNQSIAARFSEQPVEFLTELEANLEDATFSDFTDPDVLQGLGLVTYYGLQVQTQTVRGPIQDALQQLPITNVLRDLCAGLEGVTVQDFLEPANWRNTWQVASYGALLRTIDLFNR